MTGRRNRSHAIQLDLPMPMPLLTAPFDDMLRPLTQAGQDDTRQGQYEFERRRHDRELAERERGDDMRAFARKMMAAKDGGHGRGPRTGKA